MQMNKVSGLSGWAAACALLASSGCGGGDGGGFQAQPPPPANAAVGGIWQGRLASGPNVLGLVSEAGDFHFLASDGVQYFGTVSASTNAVSGNFTGYTAFGTTFQDGTTRGTGTLTGTVQERSSLTGSTTFTTSAGTNATDSITLTYSALYERDSSLQTAAGTFRDVVTGDILSIDSNGVAFMQNPSSTGCVVNGTVSIIDPQFNVYRVQYTYGNCQGQYTVLTGATFTGLATLDDTVTPEQLIVGAQGLVGTTGFSVILTFDRM
jgi:hypothetical protein